MKTITKDIETTELIPNKVIKATTVYITDDGKEWRNKLEATHHEATLKRIAHYNQLFQTYKISNLQLLTVDGSVTILYIKDLTIPTLSEDLAVIIGEDETKRYIKEFIVGWNVVERFSSGDYSDTLTIYPIEQLINKLKNDIITLENIVKG